MWSGLLYLLFFILLTAYADFDGSKFKGDLEKVINEKPCVRLFTNNGDVGCRSSNKDGNVGALYEIRSLHDVLLAKELQFDFAVLFTGLFFNSSVLSELSQTNRLQGVIVVDDDDSMAALSLGKYSVDVTTPQGQGTFQLEYTLNGDYLWNNFGNGILYESFSFPIVRADISEYSTLKKYCQQNRDVSYLHTSRLNMAKFQYYMGGVGITSKACLEWVNLYGYRDPRCLPVGGQSVWAIAGTMDNRNKVIATVAMDSTAAFHDLALGAVDAAASIAALLAAADAVGRSAHSYLALQPMFLFANAEEWGYAGSRRFVRDLVRFQCDNDVSHNETRSGFPLCASPVYPNTLFRDVLGSGAVVKDVIALDQIGAAKGQFSLYSVSHGGKDELAAKVYEIGTKAGFTLTLDGANVIPPTPLTTFELEYAALGASFTGVVIAGYAGGTFNSPYYHTRHDNASRVNEQDVVKAAQLTATTMYQRCGGAANDAPVVNQTLVRALLHCLLEDWNCDMMQGAGADEAAAIETAAGVTGVSLGGGTTPPNYYVGVLNAVSAGGGQPVVSRQGAIYGRFDGSWRPNKDVAYAVPNLLAGFVRSSLARYLSSSINPTAAGEEEEVVRCRSGEGCGRCVVLGRYNVTGECAGGRCVCPSAFYHLAVDPGVEAEEFPNVFHVTNASSPCYTEPYWTTIQLSVYPTSNAVIGVVSVVAGTLVTVASAGAAYLLHSLLSSRNLL